MNKDDTKFAKRDDCELTHLEIANEFKQVRKEFKQIRTTQHLQGTDITYIRGKIDGATQAKRDNVTFAGMLIALVVGFINILKSLA